MHIHEAILAGSKGGIAVLAAGAVATAAGTALGLRRMDYQRVPQVAILSAVFFVVSAIQVQMGPTSIHLVLNGLVGLILGWAAFPALLVALLLQAAFWGEGGLLALGVNTLTMALPGVVCYGLFHRAVLWRHDRLAFAAGFAAGALGVLMAAVLTASALWLTGEAFELFAKSVVGFHLVVAAVEGLVTGSVVVFLRKVRPELLQSPLLVPGRSLEVSDA